MIMQCLPCLKIWVVLVQVLHGRADYVLPIVFEGGNKQLMRNERDSQPFIINMDVNFSSVSWFKYGTTFVVAGAQPNR